MELIVFFPRCIRSSFCFPIASAEPKQVNNSRAVMRSEFFKLDVKLNEMNLEVQDAFKGSGEFSHKFFMNFHRFSEVFRSFSQIFTGFHRFSQIIS